MRKLASILIILVITVFVMSCKSTQGVSCDAYGQLQQVESKDVG